MKKNSFFVAVANIICLTTFAQDEIKAEMNFRNSVDNANNEIASYFVEERVNMQFGSQITTYTVSDASLINSSDLGPKNTRTITPRYKNKKEISTPVFNVAAANEDTSNDINSSVTLPKSVKIDLLGTYERILEKGYRSEKLLKSVGNEHFFGGDLKIAAKWYSELFAMNLDLEPIYYYRFAKSLASINETEKSDEMMKLFDIKNL